MSAEHPRKQLQIEGNRRSEFPSGAPSWVTIELIEETVRVWQPYYTEPLTPADALDMILNVAQLQRVLSGDR